MPSRFPAWMLLYPPPPADGSPGCWHLVSSVILAEPFGSSQCLTLVFLCFALVTAEVGYLLVYLLNILMSFLSLLFKSFAHFPVGWSAFFSLTDFFRSSSQMLGGSRFLDM